MPNFILSDLLLTCENSRVFLPKNYDFRVLKRLSSLLLPVTSNKASIRVKFNFVRFTPKKVEISMCFCLKLRFSSPHKTIEFPSTRYFKLGTVHILVPYSDDSSGHVSSQLSSHCHDSCDYRHYIT